MCRLILFAEPTLKACFAKAQGLRLGDSKSSYFFMKAALLKRHFQRREGQEKWSQLMVPSVYRSQILGVKRAADRILRNFFWPGIFGDVTRFCKSCDICQRTVNRGSVKVAPIQQIPLMGIPFEKGSYRSDRPFISSYRQTP